MKELKDYKGYLLRLIDRFTEITDDDIHKKLMDPISAAIKNDKFSQYELRIISIFMIEIIETNINALNDNINDIDEFVKVFKESLYKVYNRNNFGIRVIRKISIKFKNFKDDLDITIDSELPKISKSSSDILLTYIDHKIKAIRNKCIIDAIMTKVTFMHDLYDSGLDMFKYSDNLYSKDELICIESDIMTILSSIECGEDIFGENSIKNILKECIVEMKK